MSDVELIIKIPEEVKNRLCFGVTYPQDIQVVCEALNEGTPLPKGHGDLVDRDNYLKEIEDDIVGNYPDLTDWIEDTQAIIPADTEA